MTRSTRPPFFRITLLAAALALAFGTLPANAQVVENSTSLGLGVQPAGDADRGLAGQYNGLRQKDAVLLLDASHERRDEESGGFLRLAGKRLLGDTRELDLRWKKPGDWTASARYDEQVRNDPHRLNSAGDLRIERTGLGLGLVKQIDARWQLDVSLSSEEKEGSRLFGIGMSCPSSLAPSCGPTTGIAVGWAVLPLLEPIKSNHSQVEARASYAGEALRVSAGYHGSFYRNAHGSLVPRVPSTLNNALGVALPLGTGLREILEQPVALPPDNQQHQFDLTGNYSLSPRTTLDFKLAHARATQQQDFAAAGLAGAPAGVNNLGGRVDTTRVHLGVSARPMSRLGLRAHLRYDERDDSTPLALYNVEGTERYTNHPFSSKTTRAAVHASYQFNADHRGALAIEHQRIDRGIFVASSAMAGVSALRQETDETTVRAELRRRMTEDVAGAISLAASRRGGSNWLRDNSGRGVTEVGDPADPAAGLATAVFMPTLADRRRETVKVHADWQARENLSVQFSAQSGQDRYATPSAYGLRRTGNEAAFVDAAYTLSERWTLTGNASHGRETLHQARPAAAILSFVNVSTSIGFGAEGKLGAKWDAGANISQLNDKSRYKQTLDATAPPDSVALLAATGGLPDIAFRQARLALFARHALAKRSSVRFDLVYQRTRWNDWAWGYNGVPFVFSDGTVVERKEVQNASFIGVTYSVAWQ